MGKGEIEVKVKRRHVQLIFFSNPKRFADKSWVLQRKHVSRINTKQIVFLRKIAGRSKWNHIKRIEEQESIIDKIGNYQRHK